MSQSNERKTLSMQADGPGIIASALCFNHAFLHRLFSGFLQWGRTIYRRRKRSIKFSRYLQLDSVLSLFSLDIAGAAARVVFLNDQRFVSDLCGCLLGIACRRIR